ncbi:hypothetical protein [Hymenobacter koreensis]|uniref:MmcB family DNA repair protein n=1 Tax=Hymenobacter koreensis TaxID=1084523 RepID=A0ABP8JKB3_9BACT
MSHDELVEIAYRWVLRQGHAGVAFKEMVCASNGGEIPDVLAIGGRVGSIVIECKASRSDFLADRKKFVRLYPECGMGTHRIYCAPEGLLKLEELPDKWALLSVAPNGKATLHFRPCPARPSVAFINDYHAQPCNKNAERAMMYSALRRIQQMGLMPASFRKAA